MKKVLFILCALAALTACDKEGLGLFQNNTSQDNTTNRIKGDFGGLKLDLTITLDNGTAGTKATVKNDFAVNDVVFVTITGYHASHHYLELKKTGASQFAQMKSGKDGAIYAAFATQLENVRVAIFRKDALRSLLFIILAAVPIFLYGKGKLKTVPAMAILAVLVFIDMFPIDKRYLNNDNFVDKSKAEKPFVATAADKYVLDDKSLDYRVLDLTKNVFNDASSSYFHKSIGGYSGAKLRRYQDVITGYLGQEVQQFNNIFKGLSTDGDLASRMERQKWVNMLNTKYIIYNGNEQPLVNPCAYGNAWMVDNVSIVDTPNLLFLQA